MNELLSFKEYIKYLHIGKSTGYSLLVTGKIKGIKIGKKWLIPIDSINKYLKIKVESGS